MHPFRTQRLILRPPTSSDKDNLYLLDGNPNVMQYIGDGKVKTAEFSARYLDEAIKLSDGQKGYWVAELAETGQFVGWFVLKNLDNTSETEIGYRLEEQQWGKGYATEGAAFLLCHAFETLQLDKIVAVTLPENKASQRVLEKIGLQYEKAAQFYNRAVAYYSLKKENYRAERALV